jgi:predicted TIM-barrel fold metal-dependent hydrolase
MWLIDGNIFPKAAGRGGLRLVTPSAQTSIRDRVDIKARELLDLPLRYQDMEATGVDAQVVYPTLFLAFLTFDPALEAALCQAYNRYMAEVWAKSEGRIKWTVVPPLRNIEATIRELRFGRDNGACGVFFRGIEMDRTLDDPYFFPVYSEALSLNLAICIHQGQGAPALNNLVDIQRSATFTHGRLPPLTAFRNIVANKIPEQFPGLRWGSSRPVHPGSPSCSTNWRGPFGPNPVSGGPNFLRNTTYGSRMNWAKTCPTCLTSSGKTTSLLGPTTDTTRRVQRTG